MQSKVAHYEMQQAVEELNALQRQLAMLDVGGTLFHTSALTLQREAGSMLAVLFSGIFAQEEDAEGFAFIDRDGTHFRAVLEYLREGESEALRMAAAKAPLLRRELQYFLLQEAEALLAPTRWRFPGMDYSINEGPVYSSVSMNGKVFEGPPFVCGSCQMSVILNDNTQMQLLFCSRQSRHGWNEEHVCKLSLPSGKLELLDADGARFGSRPLGRRVEIGSIVVLRLNVEARELSIVLDDEPPVTVHIFFSDAELPLRPSLCMMPGDCQLVADGCLMF